MATSDLAEVRIVRRATRATIERRFFGRCSAASTSVGGGRRAASEHIIWTHDANDVPLTELPPHAATMARALATRSRRAQRRAPSGSLVVALPHRRRAIRSPARRLERRRARAARLRARRRRSIGRAQQLLRRSLSRRNGRARVLRAAQRPARARVAQRDRRTRTRRISPLPRLDTLAASRSRRLGDARAMCSRHVWPCGDVDAGPAIGRSSMLARRSVRPRRATTSRRSSPGRANEQAVESRRRLSAVRHVIACEATRGDGGPAERIGERSRCAHINDEQPIVSIAIIARHGGAMLAEPVGVGKTYTALAVAARRPRIDPRRRSGVAARHVARRGSACELDDHDRDVRSAQPRNDAGRRARLRHRRRGASPSVAATRGATRCSPISRVVADSCSSRRRRCTIAATTSPRSSRCSSAAVAWQLSDEELTECVVSDSGSSLGARPRLDGPHRVTLDVDDDCLEQLLALPDPIPARDESVAGALLTYRTAPSVGVESRRARRGTAPSARARRRAHRRARIGTYGPRATSSPRGRTPTTRCSSRFPRSSRPKRRPTSTRTRCSIAVDRHNAAIEALLRALRTSLDPDDARAAALRCGFVAAHPGDANHRLLPVRRNCECAAHAPRARAWRRRAHGERRASRRRSDLARRRHRPILARRLRVARRAARSERIDLLVTTDLSERRAQPSGSLGHRASRPAVEPGAPRPTRRPGAALGIAPRRRSPCT